MKARLFILRDRRGGKFLAVLVAVILLCILCSPVGWSIENPAIQNPAGVTSVPPSSISSGLINTPDPIDTSSNLVITGNVRRGSHFRGAVPYQSTTSFGANLGSSSLSSFLRDSAGSQDFSVYSGGYVLQPYYSSTQTVTTSSPGRSGVLRPSETRIDGRMGNGTLSTGTDVFGLEVLPNQTTAGGYARDTSAYDLDSQPLEIHPRSLTEPQSTSLSPRGTELLVPGEFGLRPRPEKSLIEQYQERLEKAHQASTNTWDSELLQRNLQRAKEQSTQRDQNLAETDETSEMYRQDRLNETIQPDNIGRRSQSEGVFDLQVPGRQTNRVPDVLYSPPIPDEYSSSTQRDNFARRPSLNLERELQYSQPGTTDRSRSDVLENMHRQLDELARSIESTSARPDELQSGDAELLSRQQMTDSRQSQQSYEYQRSDLDKSVSGYSSRLDSSDMVTEDGLELPTVQNRQGSTNGKSVLEELQELSQAELSAEADRIRGPHKTLDSFSKAKFTEHYMAAQRYLQMGEYYRASQSFTLASMYKPDDPFSLAGKGYALFAAGEYVSSALFISRALELAPIYMLADIDLVDMLGGDSSMVQSRIAEVEEWLARSGSAQLGFLLGYVCYRTGDLNKAKLAIESAYVKLPESPSILAVRTVVDKQLENWQ
jgi:tetratricopeptide (TPR) repeat protein